MTSKAYDIPYSFEHLHDDIYLLNLYQATGGKVQQRVESPEGIRGLDAIAATLREELRERRVKLAAQAHDANAAAYGGMHGAP